MNGKVFFGGLPTEMDVKKLLDRFGSPGPGLIPYEELEAVLGISWRTGRFRLIVKNWRRAMFREMNIDTAISPSAGVQVLQEWERVHVSHKDLKRSIRCARRSYVRVSAVRVDKLNEQQRTVHDHVVRHTQAVFLASTTHEKDLTASLKAIEQLPRKPVN